jgi:hypothetical protein
MSCGCDILHVGTWKAGSFNETITELEALLTDIPLQTGYSPLRWCVAIDALLLKSWSNTGRETGRETAHNYDREKQNAKLTFFSISRYDPRKVARLNYSLKTMKMSFFPASSWIKDTGISFPTVYLTLSKSLMIKIYGAGGAGA